MEIKVKILVIDDEEALRNAVKRILEMEGYDVVCAGNGTEGIALGCTGEFDLALIDLKMPDIDGIEVLREIRLIKPHTVCFITTAYASYETAVEATKLGADGYILKPFMPDELLHQLQSGFEKRRLMLETETLRREREESLLEVASERTRLKTIINSISDGVLVINRHGDVVYFNSATVKLLDLENIKIGENILPKLPVEIVFEVKRYFSSESLKQTVHSIEVEIKPNHELYVEVSTSPVINAQGSCAGVVVVVKNITEFKKLEYLKSQFVSMVAHELKSPMAATIGFLEIMKDPEMDISDAQRLDFMNRSHMRLKGLLQMVNDLLDISRFEMDKVVREIQEINLVEVIREVISMFSLELEKKHIHLICPETKESFCIKADQQEIIRIFTNLISNSIKYNKEYGKLIIDFRRQGNYIVILIKDTGIGLKPEEKNKLFGEFFRAKNEFTKNIHGTGLGLSIVKRIIEVYSGKIEVESTFGEGTSFMIYLPQCELTPREK